MPQPTNTKQAGSVVKQVLPVSDLRICVKVVGAFSVEGGKGKGSKDEEESNSVESVGFCNM